MVSADWRISSAPTRVEPVKESLRDHGVAGQLGPDGLGQAGDDVEHALRECPARSASSASASAE